MFHITKEEYMQYLCKAAEVIHENKDYITELDAETGDGDHWLNLDIGFFKLTEALPQWKECSYQEFFRNVAMTMMSAMGGSSGVLYGSAYLKAAKRMAGKEEITPDLLGEVIKSWSDAIAERGETKPGFKTMLDAVYPAANAYEQALAAGKSSSECLRAMAAAAKEGAESTRKMEAVRGRASYREDKSVGHLDPGAVTMALQLECLAEFVLKNCSEEL